MLKLLAGISMIALAVPAVAQNIYDSNNTLVGPLASTINTTGIAITKLNNELHFLLVAAQGVVFGSNRTMYYQIANCQGNPFFLSYNPSNELLPFAFFDRQTIWAIDTRHAGNYSMKSYMTNQFCFNYGTAPIIHNIAPAVYTPVTFSAPLSVR
jgi:hypothetical protein